MAVAGRHADFSPGWSVPFKAALAADDLESANAIPAIHDPPELMPAGAANLPHVGVTFRAPEHDLEVIFGRRLVRQLDDRTFVGASFGDQLAIAHLPPARHGILAGIDEF